MSDKIFDEVRMVDSESWTRKFPMPMLRADEEVVVMDWEAVGARIGAGGAWPIVMDREVVMRLAEGDTKAEAVAAMAMRVRKR